MNFFLALILTYIGSFLFPSTSKYERISDEIVAETSKEIISSHNLFLIGTGGAMMHDVEMLAISFGTKECLDIQRGRKIVCECAKQLINNVNINEKVRPYLHNFPFTEKNVRIIIFCQDEKDNTPSSPQVGVISLDNGTIRYKFFQKGEKTKEEKETFSEAEKILQKQNDASFRNEEIQNLH